MEHQIGLFCLLQALILLFVTNGSLAFGRGSLRSMDDDEDRQKDLDNKPPSLINRYDPPGRIPMPVIDGHPYFPSDALYNMRSQDSRSVRKSTRTPVDYFPYLL